MAEERDTPSTCLCGFMVDNNWAEKGLSLDFRKASCISTEFYYILLASVAEQGSLSVADMHTGNIQYLFNSLSYTQSKTRWNAKTDQI